MSTQEEHASHYDLPDEGEHHLPRNKLKEIPVAHKDVKTVARELLTQRFSCRYFLPGKEPSDEVLHAILDAARNAPSGSNFQPWRVHVLRGATKARLRDIVSHAHKTEAHRYQAPYAFYPANDKLEKESYAHILARRKDFGRQFYGPLNIPRGDVEARKAVTARNWSFFDAPVGFLITTLDDAPAGCYLDTGFFTMSLIVALRAYGLECCVQEAHATFHDIYVRELGLGSTESVVCGLAVGYADLDKVHSLSGRQHKMPVDELAVFHE